MTENPSLVMLIDVSVPEDKKITPKEDEKISQYKDLEIEINRMWKVKTKVVPRSTRNIGNRLHERSGVDTRMS